MAPLDVIADKQMDEYFIETRILDLLPDEQFYFYKDVNEALDKA